MMREGWQDFFDTHFPEGALVTVAETTEEAARTDDSPQYLTDHIQVVDVENDDPEISFFPLGSTREIRVSLNEVHERDYGCWAESANDDAPGFVLSNKLSDSARKRVATQRELDLEEA